jgi:hypothetical protein
LSSQKNSTSVATLINATNGPPTKSSLVKSLNSSTTSLTSIKSSGFIDPLSQNLADTANGSLPYVVEARSSKPVGQTLTKEQLLGPWATKKESILSKFTTTDKLTLTSSYLSGDDRVVTVTKSNLVADRIQVGSSRTCLKFLRLIA